MQLHLITVLVTDKRTMPAKGRGSIAAQLLYLLGGRVNVTL